VWFAILAGLVQGLVVTVARVVMRRLVHLSPDAVWMAPAVNIVAFGGVAVVLRLLVARLRPDLAVLAALASFLFLFLLGPILSVPGLHPLAAAALAAGLALQGARLLGGRVDRFHLTVRRSVPWLVGLVIALGSGMTLSRSLAARTAEALLPPAAASTPNVILIIGFPRRVPSNLRVSEPVSLVDLPATLLDLAGAAETPFPGRSLAEFWDPDGRAPSRPVIAEVSQGINLAPVQPASRGPMRSVVINGMHYIRNGDGREELYDFQHDVAEAVNLAGRPQSAAVLEAARHAVDSLTGSP
jgi:hypothetical protein